MKSQKGQPRKTHGMSGTRQYGIWTNMKVRCTDKTNKDYPRYGGRGIRVCDRWLDSFEDFWEDMASGYSDGMKIDRVDNNGNYEPSNCRWSTQKEQSRNTKGNVKVEIDGKTQTVTEWCDELKIVDRQLVYGRLRLGWDAKKAVLTPKSLTGNSKNNT